MHIFTNIKYKIEYGDKKKERDNVLVGTSQNKKFNRALFAFVQQSLSLSLWHSTNNIKNYLIKKAIKKPEFNINKYLPLSIKI